MNPSDEGAHRARDVVVRRYKERGMTRAALIRASGVDPKTVRAFLEGTRWPSERTRTGIERALGLQLGAIARIAASDDEDPTPVEFEGRDEITAEEAESAVQIIGAQLDAGLASYSTADLHAELETRALLTAALLHARGVPALVRRVDDDGGDALVPVTPEIPDESA